MCAINALGTGQTRRVSLKGTSSGYTSRASFGIPETLEDLAWFLCCREVASAFQWAELESELGGD